MSKTIPTGGIAKTFAKDLLVDPKTRNVNSFVHTVTAAASSSSVSRAQEFLKEVEAPTEAKAYGSYEELVQDPNTDIIYIATPHSNHYQNAMLCLEAGKNVLCEKAFTVNAAQARKLAEKAKEKDLFLMEAMWTRYFPISIYVRDLITSGKIGNVTRTFADLSVNFHPATAFADGKSRMINPELAGGALLDMGIYALHWVFQTLYHTQPEDQRECPVVVSSMKMYEHSAVDEMTSMLITFPRAVGGAAHGVATASMAVAADPDLKGTAGPPIKIFGDKGQIQVYPPIHRPTKTRVILDDGTVREKEWPQPGPGKNSGWYNDYPPERKRNPEGEGHGMFWEADEAAMALIEGRKEGRFLGLDESIVVMEVMDEVRRQNGLVFPDKIESTDSVTL
ncbi:dimeric dihydrodiol dehydrogenase [Exophiala viscosa]|uniref:D-xylose 1-dehydrogenase (NADP(+), D-xylono-1,5-lactone-forming) n=1 Tax=Exophiala viscosa TaxID=2486360 RepID=A0AAN6DN06_9EURO|nr:dimeric dihydrodiol dehydrogenase [Exophiala viscosa]